MRLRSREPRARARMTGAHLPLLVWLSPAFPVGAFAYSHGLEWAQEAGDVTDAAGLEGWLGDLLRSGGARNDAVIFAAAYRAVAESDAAALAEAAELALALATSAERRLETTTQGDAFVAAVANAWPCSAVSFLKSAWPEPVAYLVSAAVRLGIVGQSDGQRVIAALMPGVREVAAFAASSTFDDLGGCAFRSDLAALRHESQYTRLFRS